MQIQSIYAATEQAGIKCLIYGRAGIGKTVLAATAPAPLILSAENGLLSLRKFIEDKRASNGNPHFDLPHVIIDSRQALEKALDDCKGAQGRLFQTFILDSISEMAELILAQETAKQNNLMRAYGEVFQNTIKLFRRFRDELPGKNVVFLAKEEMVKLGATQRYQPLFPGNASGVAAPYMFDETFQLMTHRDPTTGVDYRWLRTQPDFECDAKDRSGRLAPFEPPDLSHVFSKIMGQIPL